MNPITRRDFSKAAAVTALSSMRIVGAKGRVNARSRIPVPPEVLPPGGWGPAHVGGRV